MSTNYYLKLKIDTENLERIMNNPLISDKNSSQFKEFLRDLQYIHVCKMTQGYIPLFEKSQFFSTFDEFLAFYLGNMTNLTLINEYEDVVNIVDFQNSLEVYKNELATINRTHEGLYKDERGYEWANYEFC